MKDRVVPAPPKPVNIPRGRVRIALAVAAVVIGALGVGAIALKSADRDDAYTAAEALNDFRSPDRTPPPQSAETQPATATSAQARPLATKARSQQAETTPVTAPAAETAPESPRRPVDGVYLYDTTGGEQLDLLGSATHHYPSETSITVTHTPCGFDTRWQPLKNRWDTRKFCASASGLRLLALESYREFYGQGRTLALTCTPESFYVSDAQSWSASCRSGQTTLTLTGRRGPSGTRTIGSEAVPAETVEFTVNTDDPDGQGETVATAILHAETKLILELRSTTRLRMSNGGKYREDYHLQLRQMQPQR